jgi:very-short-patch-repair endonuclease
MPQKLTKEEFIEKAIKIHGSKFDFSDIEYINSKTHIDVLCTVHGIFKSMPNYILSGRGCPICGIKSRSLKLRSNTEEFINSANEIHNNIYNYDEVNYEGAGKKVKIKCSIHGLFEQTPREHLQGSDCYKCGIIKRSLSKKMSLNEFKKQCNKKYNNRFNYDDIVFNLLTDKINLICPDHGPFQTRASTHMHRGSGCYKCGMKNASLLRKTPLHEFKEHCSKKYNNRFNYDNVVFDYTKDKINLICPDHGPFQTIVSTHMHRGSGCNKCAFFSTSVRCKKTQEEVIEGFRNIHGNTFSYSKVEYKDTHSPVIIICLHHGEFKISPCHHLRGTGCSNCKNKTEGKLKIFLEENLLFEIETQFKLEECKRITYLPFDFCIEELKIIIELDGDQHFVQVSNWSSPEYTQLKDKYKMQKALNNGYTIIRVLQDDVCFDKNNWKENLLKAIENIYNKPQAVYICENNEYTEFKEFMEDGIEILREELIEFNEFDEFDEFDELND